MLFAARALAGTFGTVYPIPGNIADIALDEKRGVLYLANFTGNRIDVFSLDKKAVQNSINVAAQPSALALSPDGRYLVITHFGNFASPAVPSNVLTVLRLDGNLKQTFSLNSPPLGVAFGIDNLALIVTTSDFLLFDPDTGNTRVLEIVEGATVGTLPIKPGVLPADIVRASVAPSGDYWWVVGIAETGSANNTLVFRYNVNTKQVIKEGWISSPVLGPRAMSVNQEGSLFVTGWGLFTSGGLLLSQFRDAAGALAVGTTAFDSRRGLIYTEISRTVATEVKPEPDCQEVGGVQVCVSPSGPAVKTAVKGSRVLLVADADNLTVRERLLLRESLTGKAVLSADGGTMYAASEGGLSVLPVGDIARQPRVSASQEDVVFRGNFCDRRVIVQEIDIVDPGGGRTDFSLAPTAGISVSPASGTTPARVRVAVDPAAFQNQKGTTTGWIGICSAAAVNLPPDRAGRSEDPCGSSSQRRLAAEVRVLINTREPDQRGTFFNVPGKLVDLLADPARNRFYILRQDKNAVLVFDAATYRQTATLRTGNTPTQMAITFDRKHLIVANDDAQVAYVYDLDTLERVRAVVFPPGHYPRSIACAGGACLVACRVAGPKHTIDRLDVSRGIATELPTLGIYENNIDVNTALVASPSGGSILVAQANGTVMLYDASADTFVAARKDFDKLTGAVAALSDDRFVVQDTLLNGALMPIQTFDTGNGSASGFALVGDMGLRATAPSPSAPGVVQRVDLTRLTIVRPTRITEAPVAPTPSDIFAFSRTVAPLADRSAIIALTTSGFTVLPWTFDAAVAIPQIERVVSAADGSDAVAPGALISIFGQSLSPVNAASREVPLPTALGESCLTVNGVLVPVVFVSPTQINGQLPFTVSGSATMVLRTPGGVSNNFRFNIRPTAPTVFRTQFSREDVFPTVVRAANSQVVTLSNPIHPEDTIVIYATGLGATTPAVEAGHPGPSDPLAQALVQPEVTLGGEPLPIIYAGLAPGEVGVYQINALVPYWVPLGMEVPLVITQGGFSTTLNVRVVK